MIYEGGYAELYTAYHIGAISWGREAWYWHHVIYLLTTELFLQTSLIVPTEFRFENILMLVAIHDKAMILVYQLITVRILVNCPLGIQIIQFNKLYKNREIARWEMQKLKSLQLSSKLIEKQKN